MKNQVQSQTEDLGLEKRGQVWIPQDLSLLGSGDQNGEVEAEKSFLQVTLTFIIRCFFCIHNCLNKTFILL